jgi:hypothetical protein
VGYLVTYDRDSEDIAAYLVTLLQRPKGFPNWGGSFFLAYLGIFNTLFFISLSILIYPNIFDKNYISIKQFSWQERRFAKLIQLAGSNFHKTKKDFYTAGSMGWSKDILIYWAIYIINKW